MTGSVSTTKSPSSPVQAAPGAAIALAFAEAGADVLIASRTESQLEAVAEQVRAAGRRAHIVAADLAHPESTAELAGQAVEAFGKLDIVVNNVGERCPTRC